MQIEGTKLIFIMNLSVLDFFYFASRMPQIAQILVSASKIFQGRGMPLDPPRNFLFLFISNFRLCLLKLQSVGWEVREGGGGGGCHHANASGI